MLTGQHLVRGRPRPWPDERDNLQKGEPKTVAVSWVAGRHVACAGPGCRWTTLVCHSFSLEALLILILRLAGVP